MTDQEPYTPSVDEVRFAWAEHVNKHNQEGAEEFDRMIDAVRAEVAEQIADAIAAGSDATSDRMNGPEYFGGMALAEDIARDWGKERQ